MKFIGKLTGLLVGFAVTNNIFASFLLAAMGHFLFDYEDAPEVDSEELFVDNEIPSKNLLFLKTIIDLCCGLINLKGNIILSEVSLIKDFLANVMKFDKRELQYVITVFNNYDKSTAVVNLERSTRLINQFCLYEEKLNILQLLFALSIADASITKNEYDFIFKVSQEIEIQSGDFNKLKEHFIPEEEDCFKILGVSKDAGYPEIKKAYRKLVSERHPDKNKNYDKEDFQKIVNAYRYLMKAKKKMSD